MGQILYRILDPVKNQKFSNKMFLQITSPAQGRKISLSIRYNTNILARNFQKLDFFLIKKSRNFEIKFCLIETNILQGAVYKDGR